MNNRTEDLNRKMSNFEASKLYEAVIEEVISDSRQDFENSGIDESTLQDLRKIWCERLSQAGIGKFSWDEEEPFHQKHPSSLVGSIMDQSNGGLKHEEVSGISDTNGLVLPTDMSIKVESPGVSQDYDDNNGLILPRVNQADGTFEFTVYTDNNELMNKLQAKNRKKIKKLNQADGNDDEDDDEDDDDIFNDSDDINSDLDDGLESEKSDDEDGDQEGQIMLCLYDKVQRVKNKWKSNLKEGVANIDGRDYVFQKATGESEW